MWKFSLYSILVLTTLSCGNHQKDSSAPENKTSDDPVTSLEGDFYFKHESEYTPEYLHLKIVDGKISGEAYTENTLSGGVAVQLSGNILSKDTLSLIVFDTEEFEPEEIVVPYAFDGKTLRFDTSISWAISTEYQLISQSEMPDKDNYGTVQDLESEMVGEYIENVFPATYQSVMPDPMKHWGGLHEYFTILEVLDTVVGYGYGERDGEPPWEFHFSGLVESDSIFHVTVCYHQEGYPDTTQQETWTLHRRSGDFILPGYNRPKEGRRYVWASDDDMIEPVREGLKKAKKSADEYDKSDMYFERKSNQEKQVSHSN